LPILPGNYSQGPTFSHQHRSSLVSDVEHFALCTLGSIPASLDRALDVSMTTECSIQPTAECAFRLTSFMYM